MKKELSHQEAAAASNQLSEEAETINIAWGGAAPLVSFFPTHPTWKNSVATGVQGNCASTQVVVCDYTRRWIWKVWTKPQTCVITPTVVFWWSRKRVLGKDRPRDAIEGVGNQPQAWRRLIIEDRSGGNAFRIVSGIPVPAPTVTFGGIYSIRVHAMGWRVWHSH